MLTLAQHPWITWLVGWAIVACLIELREAYLKGK